MKQTLIKCQNYLQAELTEAKMLGLPDTHRLEQLIADIKAALDANNKDAH